MKIGIVNTGGDVQSLNAIIAASTKYGISKGHEMIGFKYGWEGILDKAFVNLTLEKVRGISHIGGTILKTTNKGRFAGKAGGEGGISQIPEEIIQLAKANLEELGVEALIEIGGDAGISSADQLSKSGVKITIHS
jgi:ATP-dependent phosphofructokinase / diphosphate-dependent phosphofructokinase